LEDLYLPFKPKRRTKAQIAREAGLEPLALRLLQNPALVPETEAAAFVDVEKGVADAAAALEGARWILMDTFAEDAELVGGLRQMLSHRILALLRGRKEGFLRLTVALPDETGTTGPTVPERRIAARAGIE